MSRILFLIILSFALFCSCSTSKSSKAIVTPQGISGDKMVLTSVSTDDSYGYSKENPIKVGSGSGATGGPAAEQAFLNALKGPNGETISYVRRGSCCAFKTKNGFMGTGFLDIYEITYEGRSEPITLYLNMYDAGEAVAPKGFTL